MKTFFTEVWLSLHDPLLWLKGGLVFLIGPINIQLAYLLLALGIDLVFGIQIAIRDRTFKWSILFKKLKNKIMVYVLWIAMFHAFDMVAGLPDSARWSVIVLLAGLEIVSAIKNTAKLGHNRLAEGLEKLYLSLTKNNVKPPMATSDTASRPESTPVSNASTSQAIGADNLGVTMAEGGSENEQTRQQ